MALVKLDLDMQLAKDDYMQKQIKITQSSMPSLDEYIGEIKDLWESKWLTNMGVKHKELEARLLDYLKVKKIVLFSNGHLSLECAISVLELKGEVITTPFTFVSTTHAIVRNGLFPVFCDINPDDYTINVEQIESLITDKTSAIIPVHVYGNVCNVEEIEKIARKYNLKVIYDAAHAFGVTVNGTGIGNFGDVSIFSFHATKVFNTIEGGAVTFKDLKFKEKLEKIRNFGIDGLEDVKYIGLNAKMNEFQAAMGLCNLKHIDEQISKRKIIFEAYAERLKGVKGLKLPKIQKGVRHNYAYYPIVFDGYKLTRDQVFEKLKKENILTRKYFYPIINELSCYRDKYDSSLTPVAKYISERILALPMYADLSLEDVDRICDVILQD